jgi:hypothetical protein
LLATKHDFYGGKRSQRSVDIEWAAARKITMLSAAVDLKD